ncbi:MAG TPA: hypothetical protein VJV03_00165 [Pyrinomonadaceae bacterium]|nr:hypothetical protein [Pyrinomonadaceae bacterium]
METSDQLWQLVRSLLQQLPSMLALVGCLIFCLTRAKRNLRVALVAGFSLFYLLVHGLLFAGVYTWVPTWFRADRSPAEMQTFMMVLRLIYNATLALGFGLLLAAIFMRRRPIVTGP